MGCKRLHKYMEFKDLKDMLKKSGEKYGDRPAYKFKTDVEGEFRYITHKEFRDEVDSLGTKLIEMGLKNKRIAVISENRYEWGVSYLSVVCGTGLVVPLDRALPENELRNLIERSEVEAIFYSKKYDEIMNRIKEDSIGNLKTFISMDLEKEQDGVYSLKELIVLGKELVEDGNKEFINATIDAESMGIMLFTSGTTSAAKAVALSHKNICSNIMDITSVLKIDENDTLLSFLPLHHTFECTAGFLYPMSSGSCIAYCEGIKHIAENIKQYQITAMISVPILFENMYKKVMKGIEKKGKLETVKKGIKISNFLLRFNIDIRKKLFKDIHDILGGKVRIFISGAAALDPEVEKGFNALGFRVAQGYGLTETSPVISAGNDKYNKIGSSGQVLPSLEVKIEDKNDKGIGEIAVKGPSIMIGYYNNEEATKECLIDGWFYTGDLGYLDDEGFLFITGRKKNVIVLKNGKNIYPEELETLVNKIEGVKESLVYGKPDKDDDLKICCKIVYDRDLIREEYNINTEEEISKLMNEKIKLINKTMPAYKYIREVSVTEEELIKTTTQKVKRHEEIAKILNK